MNVTAVSAASSVEKPAAKAAMSAASASTAAAAPQSSTTVTLSAGSQAEPLTYGKPASRSGPFGLPQLLLPTRANAAMLAAKAGDAIAAKLDAAGISREPGFEVAIDDVNSARVTVKSNRPDAKAIEDLINGDKALQMDIHNASALASHIPGIERAVAFSQESAAAKSEAELKAITARYSDLFNGSAKDARIGMTFGKDGLQMTINGDAVHA